MKFQLCSAVGFLVLDQVYCCEWRPGGSPLWLTLLLHTLQIADLEVSWPTVKSVQANVTLAPACVCGCPLPLVFSNTNAEPIDHSQLQNWQHVCRMPSQVTAGRVEAKSDHWAAADRCFSNVYSQDPNWTWRRLNYRATKGFVMEAGEKPEWSDKRATCNCHHQGVITVIRALFSRPQLQKWLGVALKTSVFLSPALVLIMSMFNSL